MRGKLRGINNGRSAECQVDSDYCIYDVWPPLPAGDYELVVNGLKYEMVRRTNGDWKQTGEAILVE
jgi:hypothetical protein